MTGSSAVATTSPMLDPSPIAAHAEYTPVASRAYATRSIFIDCGRPPRASICRPALVTAWFTASTSVRAEPTPAERPCVVAAAANHSGVAPLGRSSTRMPSFVDNERAST